MEDVFDPFLEDNPISGLMASLGVPYGDGEEITTGYLNRAIGACWTEDYGRLVLGKPVRDLIVRLAPVDEPWMNRIPQERRRQFLSGLMSITKRALPPRERVTEPVTSPQASTEAEATP